MRNALRLVYISIPYSVSGRELAEGKDTSVVCIKDNDSKS